MQILMPEDPVFMTRFLEMEEPLLHSLYYFHLDHLPQDQAETIRRAYECWGDIQAAMPKFLSWHTQSAFELAVPRRESEGYRLHSPDGEQLISLYAVEVSIETITCLTACLTLLEKAESELGGPLAGAIEEIREPRERDLVDNFRRVLQALQIPAPPALLASLLHAAPAGPVREVSLDGAQHAEYVTYRDHVCYALSTGDWFMYTMHRSLYL
ncbi:hypothetical protein EES45_36200 [Streptomyces sp. ADI97-07]|uniref:hypothetical protein n=1 Tax=Streptomyces sp. ADI97-07 TaxID=1522762 RepID=UPI000F5595E7|nr:hypothetical protein [Streptomyces sp. ADI97-07]RPK69964.1 hypothetical protein EES45_36200 [Streptomyces sp. ADI97-07]